MQSADELTETLALAEQIALERGSATTAAADLLVALLREEDPSLAPLLARLTEDAAGLAARAGALVPAEGGGNGTGALDVAKLIALAETEATRAGGDPVVPAHLLLALVERGGQPAALLAAVGGTGVVLRNALAASGAAGTSTEAADGRATWCPQEPTQQVLRFGLDLTELAQVGRLDPLVGRDNELERVIQVLSRRTKRNPVLVGEAGVGKTAIVEGLAQRIVAGEVPATLRHRRIIALDVAALVAGAKFRGEFEQRLKALLSEIAREPGATLLFVDEMHTLVGAGAAEGGIDAANVLKPMLARGQIQTVGATTIDEYRLHVERDPALERRLQPVTVEVPGVATSVEILRGLRPRYEDFHGLAIADEALLAAAELSDRYITGRFLPDKAVDLMDEAAGTAVVGNEAPTGRIQARVEAEDVAAVVARWTGIPVTKLLDSDAARLVRMEEHLHRRVIGQEEAVRGVSVALRNALSGLADPGRPIGSFLFAGPSGVGKTLLARALAEFMFATEEAMVRFDMSEFMEREAVTRLIGPPPGYVGHERGGQLTEAIRQRPYALLLLDEIEKAHRDVQNLLLQVIDDGRLTDGRGRTVDFRNVIVIMTSNLEKGADLQAAARAHFRPEFINRLDDVIAFEPLMRSQLEVIASAEIDEVRQRAAKQGVTLSVTDAARQLVVTSGCAPEDGARQLRRVVRRELLAPVSQAILAAVLPSDGGVVIDAEENGFVIRRGN